MSHGACGDVCIKFALHSLDDLSVILHHIPNSHLRPLLRLVLDRYLYENRSFSTMSLLKFTPAPPSSQSTHPPVQPTLTTAVSFRSSLEPRPPIGMSPDWSWRDSGGGSLASGSDGTSHTTVSTEGGQFLGKNRISYRRLHSQPEITVDFPPPKDGCLDPSTCETIAAIVKKEIEGFEDDAYPGSEEGFSALLDRIMAALSGAFGWLSVKFDEALAFWYDDVEQWVQWVLIIGGVTFLSLAIRVCLDGPPHTVWIERRVRAGIGQISRLRVMIEAGRLPARLSDLSSALHVRTRRRPEDIELGLLPSASLTEVDTEGRQGEEAGRSNLGRE